MAEGIATPKKDRIFNKQTEGSDTEMGQESERNCAWCNSQVDYYYIVWRNEAYHLSCHAERREYLAHLATRDGAVLQADIKLERPRKRFPNDKTTNS